MPKAGRKSAEDELLSSRPLLLIDDHGRIEQIIAGDSEPMLGCHCWAIFGCGAKSWRDCKGLRRFPEHFHGPPRLAICEPGDPSESADRCLVYSSPLPYTGLLLWGPRGRGAADAQNALRFVTNLAGTVLSHGLTDAADDFLELVRIAADADDAELFLADVYGKELFLTACVGSDRAQLMKRFRFESGEGFPGLAFAQARPITTHDLPPEDRFQRGDGPQSDILAFISIPIPAPDGRMVGCLNLAWKRSDVPVQQIADVLGAAMVPLGNAICATYWMFRQRVFETNLGKFDQSYTTMLATLRQMSGADAGSLILWDKLNCKEQRTNSFGVTPPTCPWLASPEASPCSSRTNQGYSRLMELAIPNDRWPEPCRQMQFDGSTICCIPMVGNPTHSGRLLLGFRHSPPDFPARLLVPLQVMTEQIGSYIHDLGPPAPAMRNAQEATVPPLGIYCFGHFELTIGGKKLSPSAFQRRDALTLLKMLVLRAGRQVHRERLIDWLWPDADERAGLNRLHGVVHSLRAVIEPHAAERRWKYLINEGETYTFCPGDSTFVDLISFQEYLSLGQPDLKEGGFAPQATQYLEQAVELYRGDLYEDDQYSEWCDVERIAVQREFVDALASLARIYHTLGESKRAIHSLRRALVHDASREDLHGELIRCLIRMRRHKEAKEQVIECVRYLREELGVEPNSEIQRFYHSLVHGGGQ